MVQLMAMKAMLMLLLSFHVCLTRNHAMFQVHLRGGMPMATKHRDGRDKGPRSEVDAYPCRHAFTNAFVPSRLGCVIIGLIVRVDVSAIRSLGGGPGKLV